MKKYEEARSYVKQFHLIQVLLLLSLIFFQAAELHADPYACTQMQEILGASIIDTDADGVLDDVEDANRNGVLDAGEIDPYNTDTDGDGLMDGLELGYTSDIICSDTDLSIFVPDSDPATITDPLDADSDDDGILDGDEDLNGNGRVDQGETDPLGADSDNDGLLDGTEIGLSYPETYDTDISAGSFVVDADTSTTTSPSDADSDDDGIIDGNEDMNLDGQVDLNANETNPADPDTDGDGTYDGTEIGLVSPQNPADTDTSAGYFVLAATHQQPTNQAAATAFIMPNLIGMNVLDARVAVEEAGLVIETCYYAYDSAIAADIVTNQGPQPGVPIVPGDQVVMIVSRGQQTAVIPDLVGMTRADAIRTLAGTLGIGTVTEQYSDTIPAGEIMFQDPAPGVTVAINSLVNLTISKGMEMTTMPDVAGMTKDDAIAAISNANLSLASCAYEYNTTVPAGFVIRQGPVPGMVLALGSPVNIVVSLGILMTTMPNVLGMSKEDARLEVGESYLHVETYLYAYSDTVTAGFVVAQSPVAGQSLQAETGITLMISLGKETILMPEVLGLTMTQATNLLTYSRLGVHQYLYEYSSTVPKDVVMTCSHAANSPMNIGDTVVLLISKGPRMTTVPALAGLTLESATAALNAAELTIGETYIFYFPGYAPNTIIFVSPYEGTALPVGSPVTLYVCAP